MQMVDGRSENQAPHLDRPRFYCG